jgi:hypothetical protein
MDNCRVYAGNRTGLGDDSMAGQAEESPMSIETT